MTTTARVHNGFGARFYTTKGEPCYEITGKTTGKTRPVNIRDARAQNLLPSVTTILRLLDKPDLNEWRLEQGILAVMTTPQQPGEAMDAFIHRVLHVERVQDQEVEKARDRGTEIHDAMESYFLGQEVPADVRPWIEPAAQAICQRGQLVCAERVLVGKGYAGRTDLITESPEAFIVWDFKTTKKLPEKASWTEHVLQLAAYACAFRLIMPSIKSVRTANCYISTVEQGRFVIHDNNPEWQSDYSNGFAPLVQYWQWLNNYHPQQL